ncbi:phage tail protein [Escherichia coli]
MNDVTVVTSVTYPSPESLALVADVQYHEPYLSAALNRKFRGIVDPGFYAGFLPKPGGGMNLLITSVDGDKTAGAASVDIGEFYQVTIQHRKDISLALSAGKKYAIVLKGRYLLGEDTYQVNTASHIHAAEFVTRTYTDSYQLGDGELLVCTVNIPAGVSAITQEMIDTSERINRTIGIDISDSVTSSRSDVAASSLAVKKAYDLAKSKYTAQDASTTQKGLVQLSSETNSDSETMAATPKAVKSVKDLADTKAPIESPSLTGTPSAPTAAQGTNSTQIANTAFVKAAITALINGAPGTLDTLKEIAAAINNDPNFSTTINNALALKAPLASPALTGVPTAPTAAQGTNNTQIATTAYVRAAISALVGSSPEALDTLNELAAALGNDPNFATTMTRLIGEKVAKDGDTMTGKLILPQTSSFGINTNNILGGDSIAIGDSNTGIKHGGSGVLDLYSDGIHVLRYNKDAVISYKEILVGDSRHSINGDTYGSQWDNDWLSAYLNRRFSLCAGTEHNHDWGEINKVPNASINQSGIVQLSNETDSTSETMSATPRAVHDSIMKHEEKENPHPQYLKKNLITDIGEKLISASDPEAVWAVIGSESEFEGDEYSWSIRFKNGFIIQGGKLPGYGKPLELVFRVPFTTAVLWHNALGYQAYSAGGGVAYYFMYSMANISLTGAKIGMLGCFRADSTQFIPTPSTMMGGKYIFMGY